MQRREHCRAEEIRELRAGHANAHPWRRNTHLAIAGLPAMEAEARALVALRASDALSGTAASEALEQLLTAGGDVRDALRQLQAWGLVKQYTQPPQPTKKDFA